MCVRVYVHRLCDEPTCKAWCTVVVVASRLGDRILWGWLSSGSVVPVPYGTFCGDLQI